MAPEVLAAIISGASAVTAAGASGAAQGKLNKRTMKFNREEAEKQRDWSEQMAMQQNQWNLDLWKAENEYNTPTAQLERMREAGLNPLYYGLDGNKSAQPFQAAQPLGYERAKLDNQINPVGVALSAAEEVARIGNLRADTAKKSNESLTEVERREKMKADIDVAKQQLSNMLSQQGLTDSQKEEIQKRIDWIDRLNEASISKSKSEARLNDSQRHRIDSLLEGEKLLQSKSIEDFEHRWSKIDAEIDKLSAETGLLKEDLLNYSLNHLQSGFSGTGLSTNNFLRWLSDVSKEKGKKPRPESGPPDISGQSGIR